MEQIRRLIRDRDGFVIAGHVKPDGDAVGACFALALALEQLGKHVQVVLEPYASKFDVIPGGHLCFTGLLDDLTFNVLFCLDCGDEQRCGNAKVLFDRAAETVCIDHHMTNTGFAKYNYIDRYASSTCEMVYKLIHTEVALDCAIASAIYAGMVHDTGGFRFNTTRRETMEIAGRLMDIGIPYTDIYTEMLCLQSYTELKLLADVLTQCMRSADGRIVYACVTQVMLNACNATDKDLDGVVTQLINVRGAEAAVLLYEKPGAEVKVSFRSRRANVGRVAVMLGGGGHRLAAAGNVEGDIYTIKNQVLDLLEQELNRYD